jgi:predicted aldo/keto reductase-like oxidoreductase
MDAQRGRRESLLMIAKAATGIALSQMPCPAETESNGAVPRRTLGRTDADVPIIGLGLGPLGLGGFSAAELQAVAEAAIGEGITYFDVQWNYGEAERSLAPVVKTRRSAVFLCGKTWEQPRSQAFTSIRESVRRLGAEYLDAVLLNNIGDFNLDLLATADGVLGGLKQAQKEGLVRFLGICGHMRAGHFVRALDTGAFDIVMMPVNFVDHHTYEFENKVLPAAAKCGAGIVAMKVLGGAYKYDTRQQRARLIGPDYERAIRYALAVRGVATAVVGCKSVDEIRRAASLARRLRPLAAEEIGALLARGKRMAAQWGAHLGPV